MLTSQFTQIRGPFSSTCNLIGIILGLVSRSDPLARLKILLNELVDYMLKRISSQLLYTELPLLAVIAYD